MKKLSSLILSMVMLVTSCFAVPMVSNAAVSQTTVNLAGEHQTMNGFGASGCWWAKDVGGWENLDDVMSLLYDSEKGVGLNIYRYNLGAGSIKDELNYSGDRWTESFWDENREYNFSNDANAQKALAAAEKFAGDDLRVTLFCNSAPVELTKNNCGIGNVYWWDYNLDSKNYDAFAQYCYDCVDYFQNQGYRVVDLSPANEPDGHWCRYNDWVPDLDDDGNKIYNEDGTEKGHYVLYDWAGQEGCSFSPEGLRDLNLAFIKKFKNTPVTEKGCKISTMDAGAMAFSLEDGRDLDDYIKIMFNSTDINLGSANKPIRDNIDTITMHSYWSTREGKQATAKLLKDTYKGKYKVAQTEYCQMDMDSTNGLSDIYNRYGMTSGLGIEYGLALADVIYDDLTVLDCIEWDWWTAVAYGGYTDGLVYVNGTTHEIETSKRLYTMGNFSKFTDEGSIRIDASTNNSALKTVAFKNPDGTVSIVFINRGAAQQTALNLKGISSCYSYKTYVTDKTRDLAEYQTSAKNPGTITIPAASITTVVVKPSGKAHSNATTKATLSKNGEIKCKSCGEVKQTIAYPKTIKLSATSYTYDGKVKKPTVTVKDSAGKTIASSNYTVTYASGRKNVGKYSVKITFKGNYSGSKTLYFTINPKGTTLASVTAQSKGFTVKWKKQATQTTGYQIQYATDSKFTKGAKMVTVSGAKTTSKKITKLAGKKKYYVRVRTYKTVGKTKYYSAWSKAKTVTTKK